MNAHELEACLLELLETISAIEADDDPATEAPEELIEAIQRVGTFHERGVLTHDPGLVLRMRDGREFQITIVQSG